MNRSLGVYLHDETARVGTLLFSASGNRAALSSPPNSWSSKPQAAGLRHACPIVTIAWNTHRAYPCMLTEEEEMCEHASTKQRTVVSLTVSNLAAARELGLDVSAISDAALGAAVRAARAEAWMRENAEAITERRAWIQANGAPLADLQVLNID